MFKVWDILEGYYRRENVSFDECKKLIAHYLDEEGIEDTFHEVLQVSTLEELNDIAEIVDFEIERMDNHGI